MIKRVVESRSLAHLKFAGFGALLCPLVMRRPHVFLGPLCFVWPAFTKQNPVLLNEFFLFKHFLGLELLTAEEGLFF